MGGMCKSPEDIATVKAILNKDTLLLSMLDSKPAHLGSTRLERFMLVLWQFPKHCLMTHLMCIIPILVGCLPLALGVPHAEVMIDSFPNISATYNHLETMTHARPLHSQILEGLVAGLLHIGTLYLMCVSLICCAYDYKIVLR